MKYFGCMVGPTDQPCTRKFGEQLARWADSPRSCPHSQGVALGWVNPRAFGPQTAHKSLNSTVLRLCLSITKGVSGESVMLKHNLRITRQLRSVGVLDRLCSGCHGHASVAIQQFSRENMPTAAVGMAPNTQRTTWNRSNRRTPRSIRLSPVHAPRAAA
jgi:hypothetical protein